MVDRNKPKEAPLAVEMKYEPATLIAQAATFRTTPELMAGALYGVTKAITRADAEGRLGKFLNKEVNG